LADELSDRSYLVIDGIDGRAHYVPLSASAKLEEYPIGGIARVSNGHDRAADRTIAALATEGIYRTNRHRAELDHEGSGGRDPDDVITAHVRRLEALRRAGHVERVAEGVWRVPSDLAERGRQYDARRLGSCFVELQSHLPLEQQTRAVGATWLDRQLIAVDQAGAGVGFGSAVRTALQVRVDFLVNEGMAQRRNGRLLLVRDLLAKLRERDVATAARAIAAESGLHYRAVGENGNAKGVYRRSVLLASGRFAVLDDGTGFSLVPWQPVIEPRLGKVISAMVRGGRASFEFGRQRGIGND
jgi:hypothetical protein